MDIKNVNSNLNIDKVGTAKTTLTNTKELEKKDDIALKSNISGKKGVVSDAELKSILENINASESKISDVDKADEMISRANANILASKGDAVLSQANQSKDVVEKLTN